MEEIYVVIRKIYHESEYTTSQIDVISKAFHMEEDAVEFIRNRIKGDHELLRDDADSGLVKLYNEDLENGINSHCNVYSYTNKQSCQTIAYSYVNVEIE